MWRGGATRDRRAQQIGYSGRRSGGRLGSARRGGSRLWPERVLQPVDTPRWRLRLLVVIGPAAHLDATLSRGKRRVIGGGGRRRWSARRFGRGAGRRAIRRLGRCRRLRGFFGARWALPPFERIGRAGACVRNVGEECCGVERLDIALERERVERLRAVGWRRWRRRRRRSPICRARRLRRAEGATFDSRAALRRAKGGEDVGRRERLHLSLVVERVVLGRAAAPVWVVRVHGSQRRRQSA